MTNTDFILSRLRLALALQRLIRFGAEAPSVHKMACRRLVPVVRAHYTGFNLQIRLIPEPLSWPQKLKSWFGKLAALFGRKVSVLKIQWTDSAMSRVALHCVCFLRHGHFRWHWAGILRELRPMLTPNQLSPVRPPPPALAG